MISNAFNQAIFSASTSELRRTLKPNSDGIVKTKLLEIIDKIFSRLEMKRFRKFFQSYRRSYIDFFYNYVSKRTKISSAKF